MQNVIFFVALLFRNRVNCFAFWLVLCKFTYFFCWVSSLWRSFSKKPLLFCWACYNNSYYWWEELWSNNIWGLSSAAGDCVLMRPSDAGKPPYVARVEKIEADARNNVKVHCRWYYRPEESLGGRRQFHGAKELFLSDHFDVQSAHTIEGKCIVHTFKNYTRLENVGAEDYYCRFEYKAATGAFTPDRVAV